MSEGNANVWGCIEFNPNRSVQESLYTELITPLVRISFEAVLVLLTDSLLQMI